MSTVLDPLVSEFDTEAAAQDYDRWFRAKVQEAIDSKSPRLPHDEAVALVRALIEQRKQERARHPRSGDPAELPGGLQGR